MAIRPKRARTYFLLSVGVLFAVSAVILAAFTYMVSESIRAEKTLHAVHFTCILVEKFVRQNDGRWPHSWTELESVQVEPRAGFSWPNDRQELEERVRIDFTEAPLQFVNEGSGSYTAITPIGSCYDGYERFFAPVLTAIKETEIKNNRNVK